MPLHYLHSGKQQSGPTIFTYLIGYLIKSTRNVWSMLAAQAAFSPSHPQTNPILIRLKCKSGLCSNLMQGSHHPPIRGEGVEGVCRDRQVPLAASVHAAPGSLHLPCMQTIESVFETHTEMPF
eukprot:1159264-Pelagomonas_calceolata.AAC.4